MSLAVRGDDVRGRELLVTDAENGRDTNPDLKIAWIARLARQARPDQQTEMADADFFGHVVRPKHTRKSTYACMPSASK